MIHGAAFVAAFFSGPARRWNEPCERIEQRRQRLSLGLQMGALPSPSCGLMASQATPLRRWET